MLRAAPIFLIKAFVPHGLFGNCFKTFVVYIYIYIKHLLCTLLLILHTINFPYSLFWGKREMGRGGGCSVFYETFFSLL
jgi:hypothetical protein